MSISLHLVDRDTHESVGARRSLAGVQNTWLYEHEREAARRIAEEGTDEECEAHLAELGRRCTQRLEMWRFSQ